MSHEGWLPSCSICKEPVNLEDCKTDEGGQAVHESCYCGAMRLKNRRGNSRWKLPSASSMENGANSARDGLSRALVFSATVAGEIWRIHAG